MKPRLPGLPSPFVIGSILASTQRTFPFEPNTFALKSPQPTDGPLPSASKASSSFEYNVHSKDDKKNYPTKVLDQEPDT
jgi:hypothetical protein